MCELWVSKLCATAFAASGPKLLSLYEHVCILSNLFNSFQSNLNLCKAKKLLQVGCAKWDSVSGIDAGK